MADGPDNWRLQRDFKKVLYNNDSHVSVIIYVWWSLFSIFIQHLSENPYFQTTE